MHTFFLGTHRPHWLKLTAHELFVSRRTLSTVKRPKTALGEWALDSGGFSELSLFGSWRTSAEQYAKEVARWSEQIGGLRWAAIQDWMCEPHIIAKTGLSVREHQERTIASWLRLNELAPALPWVPVLQGWRIDDYLAHAEQYAAAGINLTAVPVVGVGSVCRRQATREAVELFAALSSALPIVRLHGFGLKLGALKAGLGYLYSADSMAWSATARKSRIRLEGCTHSTCANCFHFAMRWRDEVLRIGKRPIQGSLVMPRALDIASVSPVNATTLRGESGAGRGTSPLGPIFLDAAS